MKSTAQKLILISFILAIIAALTMFFYLQSLKTPNEVAKEITVIVAVERIPPGTLIDKKMIKEIKITDNSIWSDYITDSSEIVGKTTKDSIYENEGFKSDKFLEKDGDELNFKIDSDHRAISINVTGDSGVSDLLKPGDYVDIISYIAEKKDGITVVTPDVAKIILQNIEILAVNKQLTREGKISDDATNEETKQANYLVTLSVETLDMEKVVLAESIGIIKLALRPLKDDKTIETNGTTIEELSAIVKEENTVQGNQENNTNNVIEADIMYTIKAGDTLYSISLAFYGDKKKYTIIKEANNLQNENFLLIGTTIIIPKQQ